MKQPQEEECTIRTNAPQLIFGSEDLCGQCNKTSKEALERGKGSMHSGRDMSSLEKSFCSQNCYSNSDQILSALIWLPDISANFVFIVAIWTSGSQHDFIDASYMRTSKLSASS